LVVVSLSGRPYEEHRTFGQSVRRAADKLGRRVVFVASGDMSHRLTPDAAAGYSPDARRLDAAIVGLVEQGRLAGLMSLEPELVDAGGECGLRSVITLGGFCCEDPAPASVLSYEGPWGVGYLTAVIGRSGLDALASAPASASGAKGGLPGHDDSPIVELARAAVALWVTHGEVLEPRGLDGAGYPARAGVFVSLHEHGDLRGCIGTIAPTKTTLAEEVVANAIEASSYDPRFEPVGADELDQLEIKVDVLHAPESCRIEDLDPSRYGVIVTRGGRRGLLLPDLEGVDDVETQVAIACKKAGIADGATCDFERFKVDRYT
jgi:AmmeMemoRadiSam system protein A